MSDSESEDDLQALKLSLDQTIALLHDRGESHWLSWAERCRSELDLHDSAVFDHILGAYGGMGSFNDLIILRWNGHLIELDEEAAVNDHLANLRTAIWTSATALRHEMP